VSGVERKRDKRVQRVIKLLDVALLELGNLVTGEKGSMSRERWEARDIIIKAFSNQSKDS